MDTNAERPYWFPQLTDAAWVARIRSDYPEDTEGMSDEDIVEEYADGSKYATLWDHVGDAYADYEPLANAYIALTAERDTLKALCVDLAEALYLASGSYGPNEPELLTRARSILK